MSKPFHQWDPDQKRLVPIASSHVFPVQPVTIPTGPAVLATVRAAGGSVTCQGCRAELEVPRRMDVPPTCPRCGYPERRGGDGEG